VTSPSVTPQGGAPTASIASTALSTGNLVGRYFNLTSAVPAVLIVVWTYTLFAVGAATGRPDLSRLPDAFTLSIMQLAGLILVTIFVGLFLHPVQFGTTRLLEGYWGCSGLALGLGAVLVRHHRLRKRELRDSASVHGERYREYVAAVMANHPVSDPRQKLAILLGTEDGDAAVLDVMGEQEALRKLQDYPDDDRIMPTHLGNALRSYEDAAGKPYGISAIGLATHFHMVGEPRHIEYLQDGRQSMDISIRLWLVSLLATIEAVLMLLTDGLWLLVALAPYALALLAYRGGVAAAREHGALLRAVVDLNRFALYESMQLRKPVNLEAEIEQNRLLSAVLGNRSDVALTYRTETETLTPPPEKKNFCERLDDFRSRLIELVQRQPPGSQ
jgi:hypothetical protein